MQDYSHLPYRPCVGLAIFNRNGKVLVAERLDNSTAWQMPQGGIDEGEDLAKAAYREMREEIGTDKAEILEIMEMPLLYDLPPELLGKLWGGKYRGQEQRWIAMRFTGADDDVNLNAHEPAEFSKWKWVDLTEIVDLIVPFKRDIYAKIVAAFLKYTL